jgi:aspartate aminotransferase/aminotransferase
LLDEHHVAAVPGIGYGDSCDAFVRVSVGTESMERTVAGLRAIRALIDQTAAVGAHA